MVTMSVELRNIAGTEAALGWAGGHTIVADRAEGVAGGKGIGFNGGQLLALAIGGCFCNDLRYVAHDMGARISEISVTVTIELEGKPFVTKSALMEVSLRTGDDTKPETIIETAKKICTVSNSVSRGFPVEINMA
ncbi:MAG: OsmC family protein [Rhizobiaceae bacterium]